MSENQLAKNIMYYRMKRGLSQEKLSELYWGKSSGYNEMGKLS